MSMDDCFIPLHPPLRPLEPPPLNARCCSYPCLSQLDLAADSGESQGDSADRRRTLQDRDRPVAVWARRALAPLRPLSIPRLHTPSLYDENLVGGDSLETSSAPRELKDGPEGKTKQHLHHPCEPAITFPTPRGLCPESKACWASKERSTPEGYNRDQHAWRFQFTFPQVSDGSDSSMDSASESPITRSPKKKKSPEERNALREKRIAQKEKASRFHAETALRIYNRKNNTNFALVEVTARVMFFEFGAGCYHYNFTAKPKNKRSGDDSMKIFFAEVNYCSRNENDILLCCTVGENDAGHCYGCEGEQPMVVHPASQAYGGGHTNVIDMPGSDGSSLDSDY